MTTIVILLLIAWTGMAVIMINRANLTRNETMDTMQRAFNNKTLDMDERIRDLENRVRALSATPTPNPSPSASPATSGTKPFTRPAR